MSGFGDEIERLMATYRERRAAAGERQRQIAETTGTATSQRQTVKVTCTVTGEITALEFPSGGYKRMAPAELAETILATARAAKEKAVESVQGTVPEVAPGVSFMDLIQGKADITKALPVEPPMPDAVREYIESGRLRPPSGLDRDR